METRIGKPLLDDIVVVSVMVEVVGGTEGEFSLLIVVSCVKISSHTDSSCMSKARTDDGTVSPSLSEVSEDGSISDNLPSKTGVHLCKSSIYQERTQSDHYDTLTHK